MSGLDDLKMVRQYSFAAGPNYTASPLTLADTELAQSDNVYHDGHLRTIPGASRLIPTPMADPIVGMTQYNISSGASYFVAVSSGGRLAYQNGTTWTTVTTAFTTAANTYYQWCVFNDTLLITHGVGAVTRWGGGSGTLTVLPGTPPKARFCTVHGDYVLLSGQTAAPSQVAYSDTADHTTWPAGNVLNVGLDDGQIITGMMRFGDATVIFKERSIYLLTGATPADFTLNPTLSQVGCISPNSLVLTDLGILFMSEVGPALFNGFKTVLLTSRMRRLLDAVDWDSPLAVSAAYYPFRNQVLLAYPETGQSGIPNRGLIIDVGNVNQSNNPTTFWPLTKSWRSATAAVDSVGRKRVYFGTQDGYVLTYDDGITWGTETILGRARTGSKFPQRLDMAAEVRTIDCWWGGTTARVAIKTSVDGGTFVAHVNSPVTLNGNTTTKRLVHTSLSGAGATGLVVGRSLQLEWTTVSATPVESLGYEIGFDPRSKRLSAP